MADLPHFNGLSGGAASAAQKITSGETMRPYAHITIPSGGGWEIHEEGSKFRYLKGFEFNIKPGPRQVAINLFDDAGHVREVMQNIYNSMAGAGKDKSEPGPFFLDFEWGWALDGGKIKSSLHTLNILGMDINYVDGGIAYKIQGGDTMSALQSTTAKQISDPIKLKDAIDNLLVKRIDKPQLKPANWIAKIKDDQPQNFQENGHDILSIIQQWLNTRRSDNGNPLWCYWDSENNQLVIDELVEGYQPVPDPLFFGPHPVNFYDSQKGTIVLSFNPKINGVSMIGSTPGVAMIDPNQRQIFATENSLQGGGKGQFESNRDYTAKTSMQPTPSHEDPMPIEMKKFILEDRLGKAYRQQGGGGFFNITADLETVGYPEADNIGFIWHAIKLDVKYPYHVTSGMPPGFVGPSQSPEWETFGPDEYLSGLWIIDELTHILDETGYKTRASLTRPGNPDVQGAPEK